MDSRAWATLVALSVLWGGSFFFVGVAVREMAPLSIAASRVLIAATILLVALHLSRIVLPRGAGIWMSFAIMGLLNNALPFSLIFWGQSQIPSGLAAILNATTPISTALVAHVFTTDEKLTGNRILGVLLGLAGVVMMLGPDLLVGMGTSNLLAQGACLLGTLSYACAGVFGRRFRRLGIPPMTIATGQLLASSAMLLPLALLVDRAWEAPLPSWPALAAVLALAVFSTALAYVLFFRVMAVAGSNANLVTLLVPVSAILLGSLVLGERLEARHFAGMAVIALGLVAIDGRVINRFIRHPRA